MKHSCLTGSFTPVKIQTPLGDKIKCVLRQGKLRDFVPAGTVSARDAADILDHLTNTTGVGGTVLTGSGTIYTWTIE